MKTLIIFARVPQMGRVKTRIARELGNVKALRLYRALLERTQAQTHDPRWQTIIAATPSPARFGRNAIAQGAGDLGERMARIFRRGMKGPIVIIGTDCPDISREQIARAFAALGKSDGVIGPAEDGGYWLIGMKRTRATPQIFRHVRWSSVHTLQDTLASLPRGLSVAMLETLGDVDEARDVSRLAKPGRRII